MWCCTYIWSIASNVFQHILFALQIWCMGVIFMHSQIHVVQLERLLEELSCKMFWSSIIAKVCLADLYPYSRVLQSLLKHQRCSLTCFNCPFPNYLVSACLLICYLGNLIATTTATIVPFQHFAMSHTFAPFILFI